MCILAILIGTIAYFFPATVWLATIFISIIIGYSTLVTAYLTGLIGGDINPIEPEEFSPGYEIT